MDFDEYDYLEKTVENPEGQKVKETANGGDADMKSGDKHRSRSSKYKSDSKDDGEHRSKRSKSEDESRDQDRHRDRHRSRFGERDRDRHRSSKENRGKEDREGNHEERSSRDRDVDRDKERSHDRDRRGRDGERNRERERSRRSRSRSERHRSDRDEGIRERSRDNELRERERERESRERGRDGRRYKDKKEEAAEPEADPERDQRTVFAYQISLKATERDVYEFFSRAGKVRDVRLIMDRNSRRSKGVGLTTSSSLHPKEFSIKKDVNLVKDKVELDSPRGEKVDGRQSLKDSKKHSRLLKPFPEHFIRKKTSFFNSWTTLANSDLLEECCVKVQIPDFFPNRYVEFVDAMSVPMAIALSGQLLLSQPVMVKPSEAEKNQVQSTAAAGGPGGVMGPYSGGARRLYVGNLHPNITEDNLRQVFGAFGTVELVQMPLDESGHCKGFGFIQFSRLEDARNALSLNGQLEIAGRTIKVSTVTDQPGLQDIGANTGDLDDEDGGGLSLNASSRASLMQKLDRTRAASSIAGSLGTHVVNNTGAAMPMAPILGGATIPSLAVGTSLAAFPAFPGLGAGVHVPAVAASLLGVGTPSECLLLKNMFDPTAESEPTFDLDIRDDVEEECSRFGKLKHIYVDKNSAGFVYLRFEKSESAMEAQRALNGRWFAGKMIGATFMDIPSYEVKFPDSR
ncbi:RNA-binding protein 39-like isoform X1 [Benincasa hispida]|uniref:RNA-binding protein 39-like isoform X1 n=1 Tax=Benincasa hispida TaxID=102211 RepID=UPI0019012BD6|nr:RNA-binding protein 39-like isoform X1 [Benincasa hispida]